MRPGTTATDAQRAQDVGAGIAVVGRPIDPAAIRAAVVRALEDRSLQQGAQKIAAEMAALPVIDEAVTELERIAATK